MRSYTTCSPRVFLRGEDIPCRKPPKFLSVEGWALCDVHARAHARRSENNQFTSIERTRCSRCRGLGVTDSRPGRQVRLFRDAMPPPPPLSCMPLVHGSIDALEITARSYNILKKNGVVSLAELRTLGDAGLLRFRGFGRASLADVNQAVASLIPEDEVI